MSQVEGGARSDSEVQEPDQSTGEFDAETQSVNDEQAGEPWITYRFSGPVYAQGSTFGIGRADSSTGTISEVAINEASRLYVKNEVYEQSLRTLIDRRVLILTAPESSGKRATAINLLSEAATRNRIVGLNPAHRWTELAEFDYRGTTGYLIQDMVWDDTPRAERIHHVQRLAERLRQVNSYMVVTSVRSEAHADELPVLLWTPPAPARLIGAAAKGVELPSDVLAELYQTCEALAPKDVIHLTLAVAENSDRAAETLREHRETASAVATYLDEHTSYHDISMMLTAALFGGVSLSRFEMLERRLSKALQRTLGIQATTEEPRVPQTRARLRQLAFVQVERGTDSRGELASFEQVGFLATRLQDASVHQKRVLRELWQSYGHEVWGSVRIWIDAEVRTWGAEDLPSNSEFRALIRSLLLLCEVAPDEVVTGYLKRWASCRDTRRICGAVILGWLEPRSIGLGYASEWAASGNEWRQGVALTALGLGIGLSYPFRALNLLWNHGVRTGIHEPGEEAIGLLLGTFTDASDVDAKPLFRFLCKLLDFHRERDPESLLRALRLITRLGRVADVDGKNCIAILIARENEIGHLYIRCLAECLNSLATRADAIDALIAIIQATREVPHGEVVRSTVAHNLTSYFSGSRSEQLRSDILRRIRWGGVDFGNAASEFLKMLVLAERTGTAPAGSLG
ncbi:MAG: hypothetical protein ACK5MT_14015 [Actinomycetales bacterium]